MFFHKPNFQVVFSAPSSCQWAGAGPSRGSFGVVYAATYLYQRVAVKELEAIPQDLEPRRAHWGCNVSLLEKHGISTWHGARRVAGTQLAGAAAGRT